MNERTAYATLVLGALAGALAGAGVALLLAPQSGRATRAAARRRLRETGDSLRGLKDRVVRAGGEMREAAGRVQGAAAASTALGSDRSDDGQRG